MATIAIVDQEADRRAQLAAILRWGGHDGLELSGPDQALEALVAVSPDLVVVGGGATLARLRRVLDRTPVILVTAPGEDSAALRADAEFEVPVDPSALLLSCLQLLEQSASDTRRIDVVLPRDDEGRLFGRFREGRVLGQGSHGVVHEALDTTTGQRVALKVLAPFANGEQRARFACEVAVLKAGRDTCLPRYIASGNASRPWLAMELIDGPTLRNHVATHGACKPEEALRLLRGLASALAVLEAAGQVHRDIKPTNVVLRSARLELPVLVDMGLARGRYDQHLTPRELIVGTPGYVAPEIVLGHDADVRSDLFAIGLVARYAVTGAEPFPGLHGFALLDAMARRSVPVPPDLGKLGAVLRWLMMLNPHDRPQSPHEVIFVLDL